MIKDKKINEFIEYINNNNVSNILSVYLLGSGYGQKDISKSDIDILFICDRREHIYYLYNVVHKKLSQIYQTKTPFLTRFIQKNFFVSNRISGLHIMVLAFDEIDKNLNPKSLRLKFLFLFISKKIFLFNLIKENTLLYGKDLLQKINIKNVTVLDFLKCFTFSFGVLLCIFPLIIYSKEKFFIWSIKVIKYHYLCLNTYFELKNPSVKIPQDFYKKYYKYRYRYKDFNENLLFLYFKIFFNIFGNFKYIFKLNLPKTKP